MPQLPASDTQLAISQSDTINSQISPWLIRLVYPLGCYVVMPLYFGRMVVTGRENIPQTGPVIVAPTHRSRWDALITPYAVGRLVIGRDLRFMVTATEVTGLQGWFIRRLGGFPVDLERLGISSLRHCVELLEQGEMVVIFPEGGIFRDSKIHALKRGVARIALEVEENQPDSGIKILPISIRYSQPYPSWGTDVFVKIGLPIDVADYNSNSVRKRAAKLTTDLKMALQALHEETVQSLSVQVA